MDLLLLCLLKTFKLRQDRIRHITGGISRLLLKSKQEAGLTVYPCIGSVGIVLYLHIRDIRQIDLSDAVHTQIDKDQLLQIIHGLNGLTYLDQIASFFFIDITGRHIEVLCHQQLTDHIRRENGVDICLCLCIRLGGVHGLLGIIQGSRTRDQLGRSVADLQ